MNKKIFLILGLILVSSLLVLAQSYAVNSSNGNAVVSIPEKAVEVSPNVFSLGTAIVDGKVVEGLMFVHYAKDKHENAKPPWAGGGKGGGESTCYEFLSKGAKWKTNEGWVVNPANTEGLSDSFILSNLAGDIQKWEDSSSTDIFGTGSITNSILEVDTNSPDGLNEVYFGDVDSVGAIAVTIVWGIFSGPPSKRELVEWDQIYDQVDFSWSSSGEAGKMDFENIATHELGHSVGMGHPSGDCAEETMYAYADFGETKKRTLNQGDIVGISELY